MRRLAAALLLIALPASAQDVLNPPAAPPPSATLKPDPGVSPPDEVPPNEVPPNEIPPNEIPAEPPPPKVLTPAPPALSWQPRQQGLVQVLDKVAGRAVAVTIAVGASGRAGALTIDLRSCYARPPDQPPDATAYLIVRTAPASMPLFAGWMLQNEPAASLMQDPVYDVRVESCS